MGAVVAAGGALGVVDVGGELVGALTGGSECPWLCPPPCPFEEGGDSGWEAGCCDFGGDSDP